MAGLEYFKAQEKKLRTNVEPNTYVILRIDGKAFHTWTKQLRKPYDRRMISAITNTAVALCQEMGAPVLFAYTQSDEISVVINNIGEKRTPWVSGQVQKMVSIAASIATAHFNKEMSDVEPAYFDARVALVTSDLEEVYDNIDWRVRDAIKNSISSLAQAHLSRTVLDKLDTNDRLDALDRAGVPWDVECPDSAKAGVIVRPTKFPMVSLNPKTNKMATVKRTKWISEIIWDPYDEQAHSVRNNMR